MKLKITFLLLLSSILVYPQYFNERSTEQNFEQSEFLGTFTELFLVLLALPLKTQFSISEEMFHSE